MLQTIKKNFWLNSYFKNYKWFPLKSHFSDSSLDFRSNRMKPTLTQEQQANSKTKALKPQTLMLWGNSATPYLIW